MTNDTFREVADILFGDGADELIMKFNPDGADLNARKKTERRQAQIGYASNIIGLGAGIGGTAAALRDDRFAEGGKWSRKLHGKAKKIPAPISSKAGKTGAYLAGGALGLQLANIGGDTVANRVLSRAKDKDKKKVSKGLLTPVNKALEMPDQSRSTSRGKLTRAATTTAARAKGAGAEYSKGKLRKLQNKVKTTNKVEKSYDVKWEGEISKVNTDKQQVFGWASIVEMNGEPIVDLQGDYISIDEVEKAGYDYVVKSRKGGDMHLRDGEAPVHASDMIESFIVTPEKKEALGLPDEMPVGWWVGYQVNDPEVWAKVKSGERTGFSIHGRGMRT